MAKDEVETEDEKPRKSKGKLFMILGAVVVLAAGGGGAWMFMNKNKGGEHAAAPAPASANPIFVNLTPASEPFVVNLQPASDEKYLQVGIDLKVADNKVADAIKLHLPEIKNSVLLLLSSRSAAELSTAEGKRKLGADLTASMNHIIGMGAPAPHAAPAPAGGEAAPAAAPAAPTTGVLAVLFTSFIIQ